MKRIKQFVRKAKIIWYQGNKYYCPFCGYKSSKLGRFGFDFPVIQEMQIVGSGLRRSRCYQCNSSDRERLIYAYLEKETQFFKSNHNANILHVSPETHLSKYIKGQPKGEYIRGDLFTAGYSYPKDVLNMNITQIPYPDSYFDLIICNHVLEHIPDDGTAIKELYRVLKIGGKAILQVPISLVLNSTYENELIIDPKEREKEFGQSDHVRIYGQDYPKRLNEGGFFVQIENISNSYPSLGLNPQELLFIGLKNE